MQECADYAALQAAFRVGEYAGGSAAEEVRHYAGQDDRQGVAKAGVDAQQDEHAYHTAYEGYQEADQYGVRGVREYDGAVDRGLRVGNQLICDTLEGRNDLSQDQTHAGEDDVDGAGEVHAAYQRIYKPVGIAGQGRSA